MLWLEEKILSFPTEFSEFQHSVFLKIHSFCCIVDTVGSELQNSFESFELNRNFFLVLYYNLLYCITDSFPVYITLDF